MLKHKEEVGRPVSDDAGGAAGRRHPEGARRRGVRRGRGRAGRGGGPPATRCGSPGAPTPAPRADAHCTRAPHRHRYSSWRPHVHQRAPDSLQSPALPPAPRTPGTGGSPDDLPPLTFHSVHGRNVRVSSDGSIASRKVCGFEHGIVYSARPVSVNEKMCLRIVGTAQSPSDIFFGFTSHDPATHTHTLPEFVIDIIEQPGIWVGGRCCEVLSPQFDYYFNSAGDVHYSINGEEQGLLLTGVDTKHPVWALVYLFGTAVKLVNLRAPNQVRRPSQSPVVEDRLKAPRTPGTGGSPDDLPPLTFHSVHGKSVRVFNDGSSAITVLGSVPGITFSARPVKVNEKVCLRFVRTPLYLTYRNTAFFFGFTSHDPATLAHSLPEYAYDFINKPGNWTYIKNIKEDFIFDYYVNSTGDVHFSINGEDKRLLFTGVDTINPLWAFVAVRGNQTVQFVAPMAPNQVRRQNQSPVDEDILKAPHSTGTGGTPDDLPPLTFHSVHGEGVRVSRHGSIARKVQGHVGAAIYFSARPIMVNEKVCLNIVQTEYSSSGLLFFGFTSHDPATLAHSLPADAYDFINKPGNWAHIENFNEDFIFDYYVNSAGDVHFSINGEEERLLFTGVDTENPLWAFVDVSGNQQQATIQFVAPRAPDQVRRQNQSPVDEDILVGSLSSLCINKPLPPTRYANPLVPLSLHRTKGRNVQLLNDRGVAARVDEEFGQGYVFTAQPMRPGQTIVLQILSTESGRDAGILSIGLTPCDPASLRRMLMTEAVTSLPQQSRLLTGTAAPLAGAGGTVLVDNSPPQNNAQNAADHRQGLTLTSAHNIFKRIQASSQPYHAGQQPAKGNLAKTECTNRFDNPIGSALFMCRHVCIIIIIILIINFIYY